MVPGNGTHHWGYLTVVDKSISQCSMIPIVDCLCVGKKIHDDKDVDFNY